MYNEDLAPALDLCEQLHSSSLQTPELETTGQIFRKGQKYTARDELLS